MIVRLFTLNKRENSTLRPTGTGTEFNCVLKEDTSMISPSIIINFADQSNPQPHIYNYAYIPDFGRYYYVADQKSMRGLHWEYSLVCDVLATYKTEIGNWEMYILRSSAEYNGNVVDEYYPLLTAYEIDEQTIETPWAHVPLDGAPAYYISITRGCFILGVIAKPEASGLGSYGSIKYIVLTYTQMITLISALLNNNILTSNGFSTNDASLSLQKSLINPLSYIKSCYWLPFQYTDIVGAEVQTVDIWDWSVTATCKILSGQPMKENSHSFTLSKHPAAGTRGRYLNSDPYTNYTLSFPPFGIIQLNSMDLIETNRIRTVSVVDLVTGAGRLEIYTEDDNGTRGRLLQKVNAQVCVPIQLAEVGYDYSNIAATAVGTGAEFLGSFLGNFASAVDSGLTTAVSKIGNAANASRSKTMSMGSAGNFSDLNGYVILTTQCYYIAAEDQADVGRPLCAKRLPKNIPGFMVCRSGDVPIAGTSGEQQQVRAFLEGGFFYE